MLFVIKSCQRLTQQSSHIFLFQSGVFRTSSKTATVIGKVKTPLENTSVRHVVGIIQAHDTDLLDLQQWRQHATVTWKQLPQHYLMLSKIRLTSLVVMTSMAGYTLAPSAFDLQTFALCSVGTGLLSCAANAINQYHEVPFDAQMARTRNRILVRGLLTPLHALGFASVCAVTGLTTLYFGINTLTTAFGMTNLILYTSIYTPLKRISIINTWVGSIVGALPPLMGWTACTGTLDPSALILGGLLYAWQFPHFNALSWNLRPDYSRAGYRMMAVTDPGLCRRTALRYTAIMLPLSCSLTYMGVTNFWFVLESIPLNAYFTFLAWKFYKNSDSSSSRQLFRFSLLQLPILMLLMLINKKNWHTDNEEESVNTGASAIPNVDNKQLGLTLVVDSAL